MLSRVFVGVVVLFTVGFGCSTYRPSKQILGSSAISSIAIEDLDTLKPTFSSAPIKNVEILDSPILVESDVANSEKSVRQTVKPIRSNTPLVLEAIPFEMNEHVQRWIDYFCKRDRARFQRFMMRGSQYREVVESLLEENGIPPQIYYLAMIESGYQTSALSTAKASGVWQFIPATGRRYGLQINSYNDERQDPIRATEAAAKYLKDLYNVFGSWYLAIAAYNAGEYRIMGSVIRGKSRDFWTLVKMKVLPLETANYIPKFLAALTIGENFQKYGFEEPLEEKYPNLEAIEVPSPVRLDDVARAYSLSVPELQRVNPNLRRSITPPDTKNYEVWIPEEKVKAGAELQLVRVHVALSKLPQRITSDEARNYYKVRTGESLKSVAHRNKVSVSYLKRLNRLSSNRLYPGLRLRITAKSYRPKRMVRYNVRRGDNLNTIAKKFGITVQRLKVMNSLKGNNINVGQHLLVKPEKT